MEFQEWIDNYELGDTQCLVIAEMGKAWQASEQQTIKKVLEIINDFTVHTAANSEISAAKTLELRIKKKFNVKE